MNVESPDRPTPVGARDRIDAMDVLRGVALCGILLMNVRSFALPPSAYFFPYSWGDMTGLNGVVWHLTELLAASKFITLFSMLFGAGIILMYDRACEAGRGLAGLHYRRIFWLLVIGLGHSYLLWEGDILVSYAVCGLWVFLFRRRSPRMLIITGLVFLLIGSAIMCGLWYASQNWPEEVVSDITADLAPTEEYQLENIRAMRGGFQDQWSHRFPAVVEFHVTTIPYYMLWRAGGTMLLGMALFKLGWITGRASSRTYRILLGLGLLVGIPLTYYGIWRNDAIGWEPIRSFFSVNLWGYWASFVTALGWLGLVMLWCRSDRALGLRDRFAAVGRMALTNYLMQTVVGMLAFTGYGLQLFDKVPHLGQLAFCVVVWIMQLLWSPWWLSRFRFGPVEWAWRSLAYRKRQAFRRPAASP